MTEKILFGAEVNQIQRTLFAGGLQRQVVGGSRLLADFSETVITAQADAYQFDAVVNDGGKFRLIFARDQADQALQLGAYLSDLYRLLLNGPLTVAPVVAFDDAVSACANLGCGRCYACAERALAIHLNEIKEGQSAAWDTAHAPTTAFCQSSGSGLAQTFKSIIAGDDAPMPSIGNGGGEDHQYMAAETYAMKEVGHATKRNRPRVGQDNLDTLFLGKIAAELPAEYREWNWVYLPEELSAFDLARSNIAYMVADGNNMGKYFSRCRTPDEARALSQAVQRAVYKAIAGALPQLVEKLVLPRSLEYLPMLPLIAAGDDIFLMLPAPYALDYARAFCLAFEDAIMAEPVVADLLDAFDSLNKPTMSAAVVICKESYPYNLAHQRGEALLAQTKQVVKTTGLRTSRWLSALSFDMIIGSELVSAGEVAGDFRAGLGVYWALSDNADGLAEASPDVFQAALDLRRLLDQRLALDRLPTKRRAELRDLHDVASLPADEVERERWQRQLKKLLRRVAVSAPGQNYRSYVVDALRQLGEPEPTQQDNPGHWLRVRRGGQRYYANGLPDLLQVWAYAQKLDRHLTDYEEVRDV